MTNGSLIKVRPVSIAVLLAPDHHFKYLHFCFVTIIYMILLLLSFNYNINL